MEENKNRKRNIEIFTTIMICAIACIIAGYLLILKGDAEQVVTTESTTVESSIETVEPEVEPEETDVPETYMEIATDSNSKNESKTYEEVSFVDDAGITSMNEEDMQYVDKNEIPLNSRIYRADGRYYVYLKVNVPEGYNTLAAVDTNDVNDRYYSEFEDPREFFTNMYDECGLTRHADSEELAACISRNFPTMKEVHVLKYGGGEQGIFYVRMEVTIAENMNEVFDAVWDVTAHDLYRSYKIYFESRNKQ